MNVIDSLVVVLGLDTSKFTQEQRNAVEAFRKTQDQAVQSGKDIEAQGKKVDEFFSSMKRGALALGAAFFGGKGVKEFIGYITTMDAGIARVSRTLGESATELSAWQNIARQAGGSTESITSAFHGLTQEMNLFLLGRGGESALLPVLNTLGLSIFDEAKNLKTASRLYLEIADALQKSGTSAPRASALLSLVPGMNQETINLLLKGRTELEKMLEEQRKLTNVTDENAKAAERLASAWGRATTAAENFGRALLNAFSPAMVWALNKVSDLFSYKVGPGGLFGIDEDEPKAQTAPRSRSGGMSDSETEAYIRAAARKRGIDPDIAVKVWDSEGRRGYVGDRGSSFGPFQLHYGGVASGGMAVSGLGDKFTKQTGLDARDKATVQQQIDFSLDEAMKSGWGAWHGWKGLPWAGIGTGGGAQGAASVNNSRANSNTSTSTVSIGKIEVNTSATDAEGIARDIGPAMQRSGVAASANNALR